MIFKALNLDNIRSYKRYQIDFPLGTSLFEGDIGSGKSTILMAIEFALFGLGNQKGDSLLRKGSKRGTVVLEFENNGKNYLVERSLTRKDKSAPVRQGKSILSIDGAIYQFSPTEIKEKILEILNFNESPNPKSQSFIFRYAIYTPQEEMKNILSQKPDVRLQTLRRAFGIEEYKIAIENSLLISNYLKEIKRYFEGQIVNLNDKKQEFEELHKSKLSAEKDMGYLTIELSKYESIHDKEKSELEQLNSIEAKIKEIKVQIPHLKTQINDKELLIAKYSNEIKNLEDENQLLNQDIANFKKVEKPSNLNEEQIKGNISALKSTINKRNEILAKKSFLNDEKTDLESKLGDYKVSDVLDLTKEKQNIIKALEKKEDLITGTEEQNNEILKNKFRIGAVITELKEKQSNLDGVSDVCPICDSVLDDSRKKSIKNEREAQILEKSKEIEIIEEQLNRKSEDLKNLLKERDDYKNLIIEFGSLIVQKEKLDNLNGEIFKLNNACKALDLYMSSLEKDSSEISTPNELLFFYEEILEKIRYFNKIQGDIAQLNNQLIKNQNKIQEKSLEIESNSASKEVLSKTLLDAKKESEQLFDISDQIEKLKKEHQTTSFKFQDLKARYVKTKTLIDRFEIEIEKINSEIINKEKIKSRSNIVNDNYIWINDYLIPTLNLIEKRMMKKIFIDFNNNFQKWFKILIDDYSKAVKINEEFTPIVEQDGFEQEINYLSGGEKTSVAFAYRLALNSIVQVESTSLESNVLILDEPTDGFSKEQLFKIRDILDELKTEQLIMVSHEQELESFADHTFRVEKVDGNSTIVDL
ncbi:MAG: SMC family ATPase [Methanobacteriaceae archaeon]|jgi:exonuclease SbcC|nr:SMC family ATPase [Methanobacteriaceae archaeon]MDO9626146.1 SMC family ATPase [Methanobacteriaceae archaeon]